MKLRIYKGTGRAVATIVGILFLCIVLFRLLVLWENHYGMAKVESQATDINTSDEGNTKGATFYEGEWYTLRQNMQTVLLIGLDKFQEDLEPDSYRNTQQADFLMLLILDCENGSYKTLHINRDTMTEIPTMDVRGEPAAAITGQLALAHTYGSGGTGSGKNTALAVSEFLYNIPIDHYISFTMDAVSEINDYVGGVRLTMLDDFTMYNSQMMKGKDVLLTGDMALTYVRERKELEENGNLNRMKRQRQYLAAAKDCARNKMNQDEEFPLKVLELISEYMVSDCTINQLTDIGDKLYLYEDNEVEEIKGEAVTGAPYMEFYPDEGLLRRQVISLFYEPQAKQVRGE